MACVLRMILKHTSRNASGSGAALSEIDEVHVSVLTRRYSLIFAGQLAVPFLIATLFQTNYKRHVSDIRLI